MALTFTRKSRRPVGDLYEVVYEVQFDNSYPTGGEVYAASDFGLAQIEEGWPWVVAVVAGGNIVQVDYTNKKFLVFFFDYNNAGDGPAIEVLNASDQSAVKIRVAVRGR